jgi:hypothetical protein
MQIDCLQLLFCLLQPWAWLQEDCLTYTAASSTTGGACCMGWHHTLCGSLVCGPQFMQCCMRQQKQGIRADFMTLCCSTASACTMNRLLESLQARSHTVTRCTVCDMYAVAVFQL